jgi:hypothetical protein
VLQRDRKTVLLSYLNTTSQIRERLLEKKFGIDADEIRRSMNEYEWQGLLRQLPRQVAEEGVEFLAEEGTRKLLERFAGIVFKGAANVAVGVTFSVMGQMVFADQTATDGNALLTNEIQLQRRLLAWRIMYSKYMGRKRMIEKK